MPRQIFPARRLTLIIAVIGLVFGLAAARPLFALDSADLMFDLSFDHGVTPDFARGSGEMNWGGSPLSVFGSTNGALGAVAKTPEQAQPRLVDGLIGKGYLFGGKGSTLEYFFGEHGRRGCDEMYGPRVNMYGDTGTIALWIRGLTNSNNMTHMYWRADCPGGVVQLGRGHYMSHFFTVGGSGGADLPLADWMHLAMTWRKGEVRLFVSGYPLTVVNTPGLTPPTLPERFYLAATGLRTAEFCKKEYEDDTVMDELQIFRRALTPEEIWSLFERGHTNTALPSGASAQPLVMKPQREFAVAVLGAPKLATPITVDGRLEDWAKVPAHGGFIEQRLGVLDRDPGKVWAAVDDATLYLAFECPVDKSIHDDPTHVWYPTGEFKADAQPHDGDVTGDDYVAFVLKGANEYRFAVNAKGAWRASRDGDASWRGNAKAVGRSDFTNWTVELAVPLADLGLKLGETVNFNVLRSWKLFTSAQTTLCTDVHAAAGLGKLVFGAPATAAIEGLGQPDKGDLDLTGRVVGPAGKYTLKVRGKEWAEETAVAVGADGSQRFELKKQIAKPGDMALIVEVLAPDGQPILVRTIPFVYVPTSLVELINYPGWGKLDVSVTPVAQDTNGVQATVALEQAGHAVLTQPITAFSNPVQVVRFEVANLATGKYEVVTRLLKSGQVIGADRQPYEKKPLPEWYHCQAGVIDGPPVPWTDVQVKGDAWWQRLWGKDRPVTVACLLKEITYRGTLLPAKIVSNGQDLLSGPMRLRIKRSGRETVISAGEFKITERTRRKVSWESVARDGDLTITVKGWTEFDGFTWADLTFAGGKVEHLALEIPWRRECATLKQVEGKGVLGDQPIRSVYIAWIGNEKAGLQVGWEHQYNWVLSGNGEPCTIVPSKTEVVASIPFIQKETAFAKPRTVNVCWAISPTKPVRSDWRTFDRYLYRTWTGANNYPASPNAVQARALKYRYLTYGYVDWCTPTPNYPKTIYVGAQAAPFKKSIWESYRRDQAYNVITSWYAYGPFAWVGSPEYADWWREWRDTTSPLAPPDANTASWGPACFNSSSADLFLWLLAKYVKEYPCRGLYFDCMPNPYCANEAHGCGFVDGNGVRQPVSQGLAARRFFERVYNIIKAADPQYGWIRHHDWGPNLATAAFCDENWIGEGFIGPIRATPEQNYYHVVDLPMARVDFNAEHFGHLTAWLGELGCTPEWAGDEVEPGQNGQPGKWALPRWKDYEHEIGLSFVNDTFTIGGNESPLPAYRLAVLQDQLGWGPDIRFIGYWELGDRLEVGGGVPEKIVCSIYYRPPTKQKDSKPFLLLVPMNNTDAAVTLTLKPNLARLGFAQSATVRFRDAYRAVPVHQLCQPNPLTRAKQPGYLDVPATDAVFVSQNGTLTVPVEKRNFRALLLEPEN